MKARRPARHAFTVLELLVVIAIISILATILLPAVNRVREEARKIACMSNLGQLGKAIAVYSQHNEGIGPFEGPTDHIIWNGTRRYAAGLLFPYIGGNLKVLYCPSSGTFTAGNPGSGIANFGVSGKTCWGGYYMRGPKDFDDSLTETSPLIIEKFPRTMFMCDIEYPISPELTTHKDGINVLKCDASVQWLDGERVDPGETFADFWHRIDKH